MSEQANILFVMPALRTVDYTRLAYRSFVENSDARHTLRIGLDLDVEEDKEFYRREGIPFDVFHGWGHWTMACYYVKQILDGHLSGYQYIGLIHNDMVCGHNWLAPFDALVHPAVDNTLYCFKQENPDNSTKYGSTIETFDYLGFQTDTRETYTTETTNTFAFLPWVVSVEAFMTTFQWLAEGDAGIWKRRDFPVMQFQTRVWHFLGVAVRLHHADYLNNQTTRLNWNRFVHDPRFRYLIAYLYENTVYKYNGVTEELYRLCKEFEK